MKVLRWYVVILSWVFALGGAAVFIGGEQANAIEVKGSSYFPTFSQAEDSRSEGWFLSTRKPGERFVDFVTVYNGGDAPLALRLYPADAVFTSEGAFGLAAENQAPNQTIGKWVKMGKSAFSPLSPLRFSQNERKLLGITDETETKSLQPLTREELIKMPFSFLSPGASVEITIPPRERKIVPFEITIPLDAEVGDHAGGIVVEDRAVTKKGNISWVDRVGVRMYVTIPGQRIEKLELFEKEIKETFESLRFAVTLKNSGNVRLQPTFQFVMQNPFTGEKQTIERDPKEIIFPKQKTAYAIQFEKQGVGVFQYELFAIAGTQKILAAEGFYTPPLSLLIGGGIIVFVLALFFFWLLRKRKKKKEKEKTIRRKTRPQRSSNYGSQRF